jgi:hypothetical protein
MAFPFQDRIAPALFGALISNQQSVIGAIGDFFSDD